MLTTFMISCCKLQQSLARPFFRLAGMEEKRRKLTEETGTLHQENTTLLRTNKELVGEDEPNGNEHVESRHDQASAMADEERRWMHLVLRELGNKYAEIAKRLDTPSTID